MRDDLHGCDLAIQIDALRWLTIVDSSTALAQVRGVCLRKCHAASGAKFAPIFDTAAEARDTGADLNMPLEPRSVATPAEPFCCAAVARTVLARCLAIGLTAAVHAGRYRWEGTFRVTDAIDRAAWDLLSTERGDDRDHDRIDTPTGPAAHAAT